MKKNIYFTYLNCENVESLALKYFNDYCSKIIYPNDGFSKWINNFCEKGKFSMMICDIWTRIFMKDHPIRYKLNAAMAIIECRHKLLKNTFHSPYETGLLSLIPYLFYYPIIMLIALIIITPFQMLFTLRIYFYGKI